MNLLTIKNVSKSLSSVEIIKSINFTINKGDFFTILGPSGCGKTTLIRIIAGMESPDTGEVILDGVNITNLAPEKRRLHTVFQNYALFPHMTVFDNIAFPLKMAKWKKNVIKTQVQELLEDVKLTDFINRYPHQLSGGQKQRVAIARALVDRPKLLLLDEPLSALDARLKTHMHVELTKLQEELGITFIYVTHDQDEALALSSKIAIMNLGNIEQIDEPQILYEQPKTYFVANFIGKCNLIPAVIIKTERNKSTVLLLNNIEITINVEYPVMQKGWFSLRPEKITAYKNKQLNKYNIASKISNYYYYGDSTLYTCVTHDTTILVSHNNNKHQTIKFYEENEDVILSFDLDAGIFLTQ